MRISTQPNEYFISLNCCRAEGIIGPNWTRIFELHGNGIGGAFAISLGHHLGRQVQGNGGPLVGDGREAIFLRLLCRVPIRKR